MPAEFGHAGFERYASTGRGFLKQHNQGVTLHMILITLPVVLDGSCQFKHMTDIFITPKFPVNQMFDVVHGGRWTPH